MVLLNFVLAFGVFAFQYLPIEGIVITLPDGQIEGVTSLTRANTTLNSFLALRYAKPPVGSLRFQPPQPVEPWQDVYDATSEKHVCFQTDHDSPKENEDCLFINVFTSKDLTSPNVTADLPVMVFIHGGAFYQGSGYMNEGGVGPKFFVDYGVVLASFNYRLGPFGFVSTNDEVIPGNMGLKDQVEALKWVQKNIQYFGGDPNKVTIFGESAGAASVSYHLLSPLSKGLFIGAIMESGSALAPWAYQPDQRAITQQTAALVNPNAPNSTSAEMYNILMKATASEIDKASYQMCTETQLRQGFIYSPVFEKENEDAFISKKMYGLFESGEINNVPVIIGMNSEECLAYVESNTDYSFYDKWHSTLVQNDMHLTDPTTISTVGDLIYDFYVGQYNRTFAENIAYPIKYNSMAYFDKGSIKQAELQAKHSQSVWYYDMTYDGKMGNNIKDRIVPYVEGMGNVTHGEEMNYIFSRWYSNDLPDNTDRQYFPESDWKVHERMMTLWTNFAKYQNPTPQKEEVLQNLIWSNVDTNQFKYLDIGKDLRVVEAYPKDDMFKFWKNLFETYAIPPFDTF